jgi:hypothetical protein
MSVYKKLPPESILQAYSYDSETGIFTHKKKLGAKESTVAGCDNGYGYLRISHKKKSYYAHRLAWFFVYGRMTADQIDHINGNKSDNRISNLREATAKENQHYKKDAQKNSKSGVLGVSWHEKAKKWQAHFMNEYIGIFNSIEDASNAYRKVKEML